MEDAGGLWKAGWTGASVLPFLAACCTLHADPMGSVQGGGTVRLDAEHPTISLDRERLVIEPLPGVVRIAAELEFRNHGDDCEAAMQFPILLWHPGSGQDPITAFSVEVEGTELRATKEPKGQPIELQGASHGCAWYRFRVAFEAGETRRLTVRYEETPADQFRPQVPYVLATGGTWKGAIREFELRIRLGDRRNFHDIELKGDDRLLPYEEHDGTLVWRCADYNGVPQVLWFRALPGPASIQVHGGGWPDPRRQPLVPRAGDVVLDRHPPTLRWHEGALLMRLSSLAQALMARQDPVREGVAQLSRDDRRVELDVVRLPTGRTRDGITPTNTYVAPEPALRALGGALEVTRNQAGDLEVSLTALPDSAECARLTALSADQRWEFRLRCLSALAERWPTQLREVAEELCACDRDHPIVLLAALGYLADVPQTIVTPESVLPRLDLPDGDDRAGRIARIVIATQDDAVVRGGALALASLDARAARDYMCEQLRPGAMMYPRGPRNVGLCLRAMGVEGAREAIVRSIEAAEDGKQVQFGLVALAYLGEDEAIPVLIDAARGQIGGDRWVAATAAVALPLIGTEDALQACATLAAEEAANTRLCWWLLHGLERAVAHEPSLESLHLPPPLWARDLSLDETRRIVAPLAERLKGVVPEQCQEALAAILDRVAQLDAAASG